MELQTLFEMEDIAVSESVYHVVSSVPDFQTKLADSRPARLALLCLFKNGGGERWKIYGFHYRHCVRYSIRFYKPDLVHLP
jgi:hypothetical protein